MDLFHKQLDYALESSENRKNAIELKLVRTWKYGHLFEMFN